jgi:hypothetical protein
MSTSIDERTHLLVTEDQSPQGFALRYGSSARPGRYLTLATSSYWLTWDGRLILPVMYLWSTQCGTSTKPPVRTSLAYPQRIAPSTRTEHSKQFSAHSYLVNCFRRSAFLQSHRLATTHCMLCLEHQKGKVATSQGEASIYRYLEHIVKVYIKMLHSSAREGWSISSDDQSISIPKDSFRALRSTHT